MKVFKFGGASVKDAKAVENMAKIIQEYRSEALVVVVSAMGKTTNALEEVAAAFFHKTGKAAELLEDIKKFHFDLAKELFPASDHPVFEDLHNVFVEIEWQIEDDPVGTYDFEYDQMVCIGEMLSTKIISHYLNQNDCSNTWVDARGLIRTDNSYRKAKVDWEISEKQIQAQLLPLLSSNFKSMVLTQGFVGSTSENFSSTLGREGSDFSAAILASALDAEEVVIWKDVDGMLNADPKYFEKTVKLNNISYLEAIELAYFGASVIHPKTIKPLQNKRIPLKVKSFLRPNQIGSLINENADTDALIPSYIHKPNQILISLASRDFSFIAEDNLSQIYACFSQHGLTINIMQNSAISFSVCLDDEPKKLDEVLKILSSDYKVSYNRGVELLTIRHYTEDIIDELLQKKTVLLEQKTRNTARFVIKA